MDTAAFTPQSPGRLVPISGTHPRYGLWEHFAFAPDPLADHMPGLSAPTFLTVANARAALAALDATSLQLPNPTLFRQPSLRREAQSTSALEGTYVPLTEVLIADESTPRSEEMHEVFNYVVAAETAFDWVMSGRPITVGLLCDLQGQLVSGTRSQSPSAGAVRDVQVMLGSDPSQPVHSASFIPPPPGDDLRRQLSALVDWVVSTAQRPQIDPVVAAAMAHYQFETIHPFNDGNGRIGRLLVVLQLYGSAVLHEPTLTVSPWFEARRQTYYDLLRGVSVNGAWDPWVRFFAEGLVDSASRTRLQMLALVAVQTDLKRIVRASRLRAETAQLLVDLAVEKVVFTAKDAQVALHVTHPRANRLIADLIELGVLIQANVRMPRRFCAPRVLEVLTN